MSEYTDEPFSNPEVYSMSQENDLLQSVVEDIVPEVLLSRATRSELVESISTSQSRGKAESSHWQRVRDFVKRRKLHIALGVSAASVAATFIGSPFDETKEEVIEAAPWVASGVVASEVFWFGGAAMMLSAVGEQVGNPFSAHKRLDKIVHKADSSNLFKTGLLVNTVGAVGDFVVISGPVMANLPPSSWGILGLTLIDLQATYVVRKAIVDSMRNSRDVVVEAY